MNEDIVSAITGVRPEYSKESIRGAVTKAQKIVKNNKIVPGFDSNKRFVKSSSSHQPHTVSIHGEGCLTCDKDCMHFKEEKYCAHGLAVAFNENIVEEFVKHLEKQKAPSLNSVVSAKINTSQVGKKKPARIRVPVVKKLSNLSDAFSNNFHCGENRDNQIVMPYYSSTPAVNVIQNTYAQYPVHVTSINLSKTVPQHFAYPPNTFVYTGSHGNIPENTYVLSSLAVSDGRVATCYGCSLPLKITLAEGGKGNPHPPFDLVVIAKLHRRFRKDGEIRVTSEARNVYFHVVDNALQPFACAKLKLNFDERSIKIDAKFCPLLQDIHRGFILFKLQ